MTEIADAEAAEVLWASSDQGKAAVRAALDRAWRVDPEWTKGRLDPPDIAAIVYAAYLAAGWDAEPAEDEPAHLHSWVTAGVQQVGKSLETLLNLNPARTIALLRCSACGDVATRTLPGSWTMEDLRGVDQQ
jgi:urease accessory protein UreF